MENSTETAGVFDVEMNDTTFVSRDTSTLFTTTQLYTSRGTSGVTHSYGVTTKFPNSHTDLYDHIENDSNRMALLLICVAILSFLGNMVIFIIAKLDERLHHMTYMFLTSLGLLNVVMSVTVMPLGVAVAVTGDFTYSDTWCKTWISLDLFFCNNTCLHLAFANMDEYLRLKDPFRHGRVTGTCSMTTWLVAPWLISLVQSLAQYMLSETESDLVFNGLCFIKNKNFLIVGAIFSFAIPLVITIAFYGLCYKEISALKAGRYFDENGSLRNQYAQDSDGSGSDDELHNCDNGSDHSEECFPSEIVQLSVVSQPGETILEEIDENEYDVENITSFSNTNAINAENSSNAFCENNDYQGQGTSNHNEVQGQINLAFSGSENRTTSNHSTPRFKKKSKQHDQEKSAIQSTVLECPDECLRHEIELSRLMLILIACVCLSWAPLSVGYFVNAVCNACDRNLTMGQLLTLKWLGYISALLQPLISFKFSDYVRSSCQKLLTCGYCR